MSIRVKYSPDERHSLLGGIRTMKYVMITDKSRGSSKFGKSNESDGPKSIHES